MGVQVFVCTDIGLDLCVCEYRYTDINTYLSHLKMIIRLQNNVLFDLSMFNC